MQCSKQLRYSINWSEQPERGFRQLPIRRPARSTTCRNRPEIMAAATSSATAGIQITTTLRRKRSIVIAMKANTNARKTMPNGPNLTA